MIKRTPSSGFRGHRANKFEGGQLRPFRRKPSLQKRKRSVWSISRAVVPKRRFVAVGPVSHSKWPFDGLSNTHSCTHYYIQKLINTTIDIEDEISLNQWSLLIPLKIHFHKLRLSAALQDSASSQLPQFSHNLKTMSGLHSKMATRNG